jgi:excisionase family DNA binding protein
MKTKLLKVEDLAELLNLKQGTIRQWIRSNQIPYLKIGGSIRFDENQILSYLDSNKAQTESQDCKIKGVFADEMV